MNTHVVELIASLIIPAVAGLAGVTLGAFLSAWNDRHRRRLDFVEKQLQELYAPLLSIRRRVRALSELRIRVATVAGNVWESLCHDAQKRGGALALQELTAERSSAFSAITEYENEQWKSDLLPSYKQMLGIFREKFWLAEESTREHFQALIVYIELLRLVKPIEKTLPRCGSTVRDHSVAVSVTTETNVYVNLPLGKSGT